MRGRFHFGWATALAIALFAAAVTLYAAPCCLNSHTHFDGSALVSPAIGLTAHATSIDMVPRLLRSSTRKLIVGDPLEFRNPATHRIALPRIASVVPPAPERTFFGRLESRSGDRAPPSL